jgi:hypothetical protein
MPPSRAEQSVNGLPRDERLAVRRKEIVPKLDSQESTNFRPADYASI